MERCSYFIKDKALFGSFPLQSAVYQLEKNGVRCFIDLTDFEEPKTTPYKTKYKYIKYPISDRKIPNNWRSFAQLILQICKEIDDLGTGEKIYIHCKGGHGRSGIVVACVLCHYYNMSPEEALKITTRCHSNRLEMKDRWRKIGSPQGKRQKDFVRRFFRPLKYDKPTDLGYTIGMSNHSNHSVYIPDLGRFPSSHLAFQAFRDPTNTEYVNKLKEGIFDPRCVSRQNSKWEEKKISYMYNILYHKFRQHPELLENLLNTGLRPLVKISKDSFWGDGTNGQGKNLHGKILSQLRNKFLYDRLVNDITGTIE